MAILAASIVPLVGVGYSQWLDASARVKASKDASEIAGRLEVLLRLAPALNTEQLSTSWASGQRDVLDVLPPGVLGAVGLDFSASMDADRLLVDELVDRVGDPHLVDVLTTIRAQADSGDDSAFVIGASFHAVIDEVIAAIDIELDLLSIAAGNAGDGDIVRAAAVAKSAAGVHVTSSGQDLLWARLMAAQFLPLSLQDVITFADSVTLFRERSTSLERALVEDSLSAEKWRDISESDVAQSVNAQYAATVEAFAAVGLTESTGGGGFDLATIDIPEVIALAGELTRFLELGDELNRELSDLVDTALTEVDDASASAFSDAVAARNRTLGWIAAAGALVAGIAFVLLVLVARPVRRMADAARDLSEGRLGVRLSERGPTEVRVGARALNEALASLQIAEAQAIALAEERLDDPILDQSTPGELGASLQAAVTRLARSLTERDGFQRRLAHEASHDGLTKLPNRNAILRHLESGLARTDRSSMPLALLFLDIDGFKSINDAYGHHVGDVALRTIAQRLAASIRRGDLAGRLGGDEFVVVAEPVADLEEAVALSNRILEVVTAPITFEGITITPSASIGIGLADGTLTADELLRDADLAVYRAKSLGKGRVDVCDEDLRNEVQERSSLEHALRAALANDEFVMFYQPTIDPRSRDITSLEALIRWDRPGVGIVGPDQFIPTAERSDLILDIDRWVLRQVAAQLAEWGGRQTLRALPVAVNISGRHLGSGTLLHDVESALAGHDVDHHLLIVEVTETALFEDMATAARELTQLRATGVRIALDDFGTGYMSLSHLRALPVDILKIDRSFVASMASDTEDSLIRLIVDTGHLLGAVVTAEGVETEMQAQQLTEMGNDFLQGYLFSRPVDAATTTRTLERQAESDRAVSPT